MPNTYVGEICLFGFNFAPVGWVKCDGSLLAISEYDVLFNLIGTTYGGDGQNTFGVPDLRGRVPISQGNGPGLTTRVLGQTLGAGQHTLSSAEMPSHGHGLVSTTNVGTTATPANNVHLATSNNSGKLYAPLANVTGYIGLAASVTQAGGSQPHDNMMPTLVGNFCIATEGVFPVPD